MSKMLVLTMITVGTLLLLNIAGFNPPVSGLVYNLVAQNSSNSNGELPINYSATIDQNNSNPNSGLSDVQNSPVWLLLVSILGLLGGVAIVVSLFVRSPPTDYVVAPLITLFVGLLVTDLSWMFLQLWSFGIPYNMIGMTVFGALIAGLLVSTYEFWRFGN